MTNDGEAVWTESDEQRERRERRDAPFTKMEAAIKEAIADSPFRAASSMGDALYGLLKAVWETSTRKEWRESIKDIGLSDKTALRILDKRAAG